MQHKEGAAAGGVGGLDRAAMRGDDLLHYPQAQAAAFLLGREERLEEMLP